MYRKSELAAAAAKAEQNRALQNRAFDRVIASQLSKIKAAAPKKKVDTDEEFKIKLALEREEAEKRGGKKLSKEHMKLAAETGLSGHTIMLMMEEKGEVNGGSGSDDSSRSKKKKKKKDKKKKRKKSKKEKKKKSKKDKKEKKRKREESSSDDSGSESESDNDNEAKPEAKRMRTRSMDGEETDEPPRTT
ncbi:hypothetical protein TrVE_jg14055 [Triparma verrucosa]|uniref:Uncharacterized protein n=1 Tax=Triparma verrucosa TaxID=1606542 RepID=A0A9W7C2G0_9STRA|nr:hypothetical protein TrVE_jg14055 [Triparma verrucosa]